MLHIPRFRLWRKLAHFAASPLHRKPASLGFSMTLDGDFVGGDSRDRTGDLLLARQALSQLSYIPVAISFFAEGVCPLN